MVLARKPFIGTVAANVLTYGTGGLNIDGARVGNGVKLREVVPLHNKPKGFARMVLLKVEKMTTAAQLIKAVGPPMSSTMAVTRLWRCFLMRQKEMEKKFRFYLFMG
jgi:glycerol-3-phosphate O-acyltransferase